MEYNRYKLISGNDVPWDHGNSLWGMMFLGYHGVDTNMIDIWQWFMSPSQGSFGLGNIIDIIGEYVRIGIWRFPPMGGTPSYHPFLDAIFPEKTIHILGYPHDCSETPFACLPGWWFGCHFWHFPIYWACHHPNWLIFFRGVGIQPPTSYICIYITWRTWCKVVPPQL